MTTAVVQPPSTEDYNGWADFWRNYIGINVIPWNKGKDDKGVDRSRKVSWTKWQTEAIPQELHDYWKSHDMFKDGIARIPGTCWHKKPFDPRRRFWDVDIDKQLAIDTICTRDGKQTTIEELSKNFIVEMHEDDPTRLHIGGYYLSDTPYPRINPGNVCELKCDGKHGIVRCTNTIHEKGYRYKIIGTIQPTINNAFVEHVLGICKVSTQNGDGHNDDKPSLASILWKPGTRIKEGENRHVAMLACMDSLLLRNPDVDKELIFKWAMNANEAICKPPLPADVLREMFDEQCVKFATKKLEEKAQPNATRQQQRKDDSQAEEPEEEESPDEAKQQQQTREISVSEALRMPEGFYKIRGQLSSYTTLYWMVSGRKDSTCIKCGIINPGRRYKKPVFSLDTSIRYKCYCFSEDAVPIIPEYIPTIDIELQDLVKISEIEKIWVHVFGKDTENIIESDVVTVTGNTYVEKKDGKTRSVPVMYSHIIEDIEKEEELSPQDIQEIVDWKARHQEDIIGGLVQMFAPHIVENENTKEGILMVFANAGIPNDRDPNNYTRHRIHQLLIGDPGEAKSRFASYIADSKIIPGARYESAQSSTGLSLTAQVERG
jgi:hypothetical protein